MGECLLRNRVRSRTPRFEYTGSYKVLDDGHGNWRIKCLSSGELTFLSDVHIRNGIDVFLVGGGGNGVYYGISNEAQRSHGGGGYAATVKNVEVEQFQAYQIVVGGTKEASTAFGHTANGGTSARQGHTSLVDYGGDVTYWTAPGNGGSGGARAETDPGVDGGDSPSKAHGGGKGQRNAPGPNGETGSTREFGEPNGELYATGGSRITENAPNTGNGGYYGSDSAGTGGFPGCSGIVVIRNHRE